MKVKLFLGDKDTIEDDINKWIEKVQPNIPEFQMVYAGQQDSLSIFCVIATYEKSFAEQN